jgi:glutaredoxin-like protein NrdH
MGLPPVKIYSLSTCSHCKDAKRLLKECEVNYDFVDVDLLNKDELAAVIEKIRKINPRCSFPTIVIGNKVVVGYDEDEIRKALGL